MVRALLYLRLTSLQNLLWRRALRLRRPQYLLAALVAVAYFYFLFVRQMGRAFSAGQAGAMPMIGLLSGAAGMAALLGVQLLWTWLGPASRTGLAFSEAEVAFLFPAPVTRRTLIHYYLLNAQFAVVFSALFVALVSGRWTFLGANTLTRLVGWWVIFSTLKLHQTAAALTITRLAERGVPTALRRTVVIGAIALFAAAAALSLARHGRWPDEADLAGGPALLRYAEALLHAGWLPFLLWPFKLVLRPFLARTVPAFGLALGPALLVLAAHYVWAMGLEAGFEEGSIAIAQKRGRFRAALQAGSSPWSPPPSRGQREPFRLGERGRPEMAFLWKNLLSIRASINWRLFVIPAIILVNVAIALGAVHHGRARTDYAPLVVAGAAIAAFYTLLAGPQYARQDLRGDLAHADLLKAYPLAGWQVVFAEMLAPAAILTGILWLALLAAALAIDPRETDGLSRGGVVAAAVGLAAVAPALCLLQLFLPNAAMLLFPAWHQTTRARGGGIESIGQRLIFVFGQLFVLLLALLPAALAAFLLIFASAWLIGAGPAILLAAAAVLAIIGAELAVGLWWLGRRFERFDLSTELKA